MFMENKSSSGEQPRIGVYVCYCGMNIASKVDVEALRQFAEKLPNVVVSRTYKFMCSDPGQELIAQDIKEQKLNRIVVASCSPLLHDATFRKACAKAGLNPFYFTMANIREQVSWVTANSAAATKKAKALVAAAVARVAMHEALEKKRVPVHADVMVVGAGISGIHAALLLANAGKKVYLVEREPSIGGHMGQLDKTFPTLDCSACILTPKMSDVKNHPNITLWTLSEVQEVSGFSGNFKVKVKRNPRFVKLELCVACGQCVEACVFKEGRVPDEYNIGLSKHKPIYMPFPQATPASVLIDPNACLKLSRGKCASKCVEACDRAAIDFEQKVEYSEVEVGAIILATGYQLFDAKKMPEYGYGKYPNVYTMIELERLVNAAGPTQGEIVMRDGRKPKRVGIIHCVGSRDKRHHPYCSSVCCMVSLKMAHLMRERIDAEVFNFYIDMRTTLKGYEEFYDRVLHDGVNFVRGRVAEVTDWAMTPGEEGKLVIRVEDTLIGVVRRIPVDMVVLATAMEAHDDADDVRRKFNISCSKEGWFLERHPKLAPVSTFSDGIFLAGVCQGPKDIPESVAQAGAAAAEALSLVDKGFVEIEPNSAWIDADTCSGCKTCIPLCPYHAISRDEQKKVAVVNEALCKGCGTCVGACPSGSAQQKLFTDEQLHQEIEGVLNYV
jgi:heterodisulfide reductase subunit A